jgi:hypothetical protein
MKDCIDSGCLLSKSTCRSIIFHRHGRRSNTDMERASLITSRKQLNLVDILLRQAWAVYWYKLTALREDRKRLHDSKYSYLLG